MNEPHPEWHALELAYVALVTRLHTAGVLAIDPLIPTLRTLAHELEHEDDAPRAANWLSVITDNLADISKEAGAFRPLTAGGR